MNARVAATVASNGGVIRREQLLDLGMSPSEVRRMIHSGELIRLRRGVFTTSQAWSALDEHVGRPLLLARAAVTTMRRGWVLSHDSAAHAAGLPILRPTKPLVHITRPGFTNAWTEYDVRHHLARFEQHQVVVHDGMPALDLARTAVDIARERGVRDGVAACDAALRRGVSRADLEASCLPMTSWPGIRGARQAVALADAGAESVHESLTRLLVLEAGIGLPSTQFPVRTREGVKWCDLQVGNHIIEAHGMVKLRSIADGGVATRPAEEVARTQWRRERLLRDEGLGMSNVYWEDHWGARRAAAIDRLRREAAETAALHGSVLHVRLADDADRLRREYGERRRSDTPA